MYILLYSLSDCAQYFYLYCMLIDISYAYLYNFAEKECKMTTEGMEYRGSASTSRSGIPCQAWNMQSPHTHDMMPSNHPDKGLNENYCRNPDNEENGPWCYTTSVNKRWEHCDIQKCGKWSFVVPFQIGLSSPPDY